MIRAVVDTNALASGLAGFLIPTSTSGQLLHAWRDGRFELITSAEILTELKRTLAKPYFRQRVSQELREQVLTLLATETTLTPLTVSVSGVATHPEEDLVLAAAVSAHADYLVTGDAPFRIRVLSYQGVTLISPKELLELLEQAG